MIRSDFEPFHLTKGQRVIRTMASRSLKWPVYLGEGMNRFRLRTSFLGFMPCELVLVFHMIERRKESDGERETNSTESEMMDILKKRKPTDWDLYYGRETNVEADSRKSTDQKLKYIITWTYLYQLVPYCILYIHIR